MSEAKALILEKRGVLELEGPDARDFLQGMISKDVTRLGADHALWAAFLTPQGKFLHEFFLTQAPNSDPGVGRVHLDCEADRLDDLQTRLKRYKLRAQVSFENLSARFAIAALFGKGALENLGLAPQAGLAKPFAGGVAYVDPRLPSLGARAVLPKAGAEDTLQDAGFAIADPADYDTLRIRHCVPDGSRDLEVERSPLLENGFDELGGVDWDKGCFMGQELTARTKYRALIKKRLLPVEIDGPTPAPGTQITAEGKDAGVMRSTADGLGLALLRLDFLDGPLTAGEARLVPKKPDWLKI